MLNVTKQQLVQLEKGTKNISLEMKSITNGVKPPRLLLVIHLYLVLNKTKYFINGENACSGATIEDIYDYINPLLKKFSKNIILHIRTNNTVNETSGIVLDKLLPLKVFVEKVLPDCNACISNLTLRTDNAKVFTYS